MSKLSEAFDQDTPTKEKPYFIFEEIVQESGREYFGQFLKSLRGEIKTIFYATEGQALDAVDKLQKKREYSSIYHVCKAVICSEMEVKTEKKHNQRQYRI